MPILALGGNKSARESTLNMMKTVSKNVTGGSLTQCGHYTPKECPKEFLEKTLPFLSKALK